MSAKNQGAAGGPFGGPLAQTAGMSGSIGLMSGNNNTPGLPFNQYMAGQPIVPKGVFSMFRKPMTPAPGMTPPSSTKPMTPAGGFPNPPNFGGGPTAMGPLYGGAGPLAAGQFNHLNGPSPFF